MSIDTHFTTGDILVLAFALSILAVGTIWYQVTKRQIARHKAARAAQLHAAE